MQNNGNQNTNYLDNPTSHESMIYLLDSNARIAWYGKPNKCATDICRWHSLPDEIRYSKYLTETTIDESKMECKLSNIWYTDIMLHFNMDHI